MKKVLGHDSWDSLYSERKLKRMPWFYPRLDPDLDDALKKLGIKRGRFLDVGTGPGTQAIRLSEMGFDVTGTDISESAIRKARSLEGSREVTFVVDDMLDSRLAGGSFEYALDRGVLHVIEPVRRDVYVESVRHVMAENGLLFLKCFSSEEPGEKGPHKFSADDIRSLFSGGFEILSIKDTVYHGIRQPFPRALFCVMKKK